MKVSESFVVHLPRDVVWRVVGDVRSLAGCLPGLEGLTMEDEERGMVRITQSLGPMSATFEARMQVTGRDPGRSIAFSATGRAIHGAAGNVRVVNSVRLEDEVGGGTRVLLDADVAMGGMLGAVGSKVIARQASKAAAVFATNLEELLRVER